MKSEYSSLAARRYRKYQRQKRKEFAKKITLYLFKLFHAIVKALQKTKVLRRRNVETIIVE